MNDICKCSQTLAVILFADDTNLFLSHQDVLTWSKNMNQELQKVTFWLSANKLSLNVNKTHYMTFKTNNKKLNQLMKNSTGNIR